jgi:hypothetical protein
MAKEGTTGAGDDLSPWLLPLAARLAGVYPPNYRDDILGSVVLEGVILWRALGERLDAAAEPVDDRLRKAAARAYYGARYWPRTNAEGLRLVPAPEQPEPAAEPPPLLPFPNVTPAEKAAYARAAAIAVLLGRGWSRKKMAAVFRASRDTVARVADQLLGPDSALRLPAVAPAVLPASPWRLRRLAILTLADAGMSQAMIAAALGQVRSFIGEVIREERGEGAAPPALPGGARRARRN